MEHLFYLDYDVISKIIDWPNAYTAPNANRSTSFDSSEKNMLISKSPIPQLKLKSNIQSFI